jgi:signal transduction histidine kinase
MPELEDIRATLARIPNPIAVLESLFALAPVGFQIYEASGRSVLVNQAFIDLFGSEPPPGYNVLNDEIAEKNGVLGLIRRAFHGETVAVPPIWYDPSELKQVKVEKGNRVAMQATFVPLFDREGKVSHVAIVFKDLTAEMVQRDELEQERALLSAIVEQVAEGILMADERGVIRLVNRAAGEMGIRTGVPADRWTQEHGLVRGDGTPLPAEETPLWRALHGERASGVVHVRAPEGGIRALASNAVPLRRTDGAVRGAVVTTRDETERMRLEEEAQQTAHFRERFIGILGHDLRSPLTAILAGAGLILRTRDVPDAALAAAARITATAERMGRMISDLLDFAQARLGGGLAVRRKPCDLAEVARACVDEASATAPGRQITVRTEGETRGNYDPDRAAQLISNLLQNALVYGRAADEVVVEVQDNVISVTNAGPNIAEADRAVLFDPFRRGRSATHQRGLGLGLFIVQQIARAHGGDVRIQSGEGRVTFRVELQR